MHLFSLSWYDQSKFGGNRSNRFLSNAAYKHIRTDKQVVKNNSFFSLENPKTDVSTKLLTSILFQSLYLSLLYSTYMWEGKKEIILDWGLLFYLKICYLCRLILMYGLIFIPNSFGVVSTRSFIFCRKFQWSFFGPYDLYQYKCDSCGIFIQ